MDYYEQALYNHILASVAQTDAGNTYHVPLNPGARKQFTNARMDIAPSGTVRATLNGWNAQDESPLAASLDGRVADNHLDLNGRWANGAPIAGQWTRVQ